jgi:hypothetical protein
MKKDTRSCYDHWLDTSNFYGWRQLLVALILLIGTVILCFVGYKNYVL